MGKNEKEPSIFMQEVKRDINTFRRLSGKQRVQFLWDYYRWKILGGLTILLCVILAAHMLWMGQRPCRLRVCLVLNTRQYCSDWFHDFYKELSSDGNKAAIDVNQDQPFDYDNAYSYLHEIEVMTTISSQRMDAAVCGPDMYSYLLSINACAMLDEAAPKECFDKWQADGLTVKSTAGVFLKEDGTPDTANAYDGYFALDLSDSAFGRNYNTEQDLSDGEAPAPLYFVIIRNTEHMDDCLTLAKAISEP